MCKNKVSLLEKGRNMPEVATALHCVCGYSILGAVRSAGGRLGSLEFLDNEPASETFGQRVEYCPSCGRRLTLPLFFGRDQAE
jgi:hypothetical protein